MKHSLNIHSRLYVAVLIASILVILIVTQFEPALAAFIVPDKSIGEVVTGSGYAFSIAALFYRRLGSALDRIAGTGVFLSAFARELEFPQLILGRPITFSYFSDPAVSFASKSILLLVLLFVAWSCIYLVVKHASHFYSGILDRSPLAVGILLGGSLLVLAQILDRPEWSFGPDARFMMSVSEEVFEISASLLFFLAIASTASTTDRAKPHHGNIPSSP